MGSPLGRRSRCRGGSRTDLGGSARTFDYAGESDPPGGGSTKGPYPFGPDLQVEGGSDAHLLVVDQDTCKLFEVSATNVHGTGTAGSGAIYDLRSDALRPAGWTSADAAGLPILPGLIRRDEVASGSIQHAIRFTVARTDRSYLWPARHQAGSAGDPSLPPMGARFRLKATFDTSRFGAEARVVLAAMQTYGLIVADNGSNWFFQGTMDPGWNDSRYAAMISQLKSVPANAFEAVDESSLMVDPNSGGARSAVAATAQPAAAAPAPTIPASATPTSPPGSPAPSRQPSRGGGCHPFWARS